KEQNRARRFVWCAGSTKGDYLRSQLTHLFWYSDLDLFAFSLDRLVFLFRLGETRFDKAICDRVDIDVKPSPLFGHRLRNADDPHLPCRIIDLARVSGDA